MQFCYCLHISVWANAVFRKHGFLKDQQNDLLLKLKTIVNYNAALLDMTSYTVQTLDMGLVILTHFCSLYSKHRLHKSWSNKNALRLQKAINITKQPDRNCAWLSKNKRTLHFGCTVSESHIRTHKGLRWRNLADFAKFSLNWAGITKTCHKTNLQICLKFYFL